MESKKPDELQELKKEVKLLNIVVAILITAVIFLLFRMNDIYARIDRIYDSLSEMIGFIDNINFYIRCIFQLLQ